MTAILSPTKLGIYLARPNMRSRILSPLRSATKKAKQREKARSGKGVERTGGGDYYVQLTSAIIRLEKSGKIQDLSLDLETIDDHPTDKTKKPYLIKCAEGYLNIRSQYHIRSVSFPQRDYLQKENFRVRRNAEIEWKIDGGRMIALSFYLDKTDEQRLTPKKAAYMAAIIATNYTYHDSLCFMPSDLYQGKSVEVRDDGSRLIPGIETACNTIDSELSGLE